MIDRIIEALFITLLCLGIYIAVLGGTLVSMQLTKELLKLL